MAIVTTDNRWYKAIADKIRSFIYAEALKPESMAAAIGDVYSCGHHHGYITGIEEGYENGYESGVVDGKQAEQDRFWEVFQGSTNATGSCMFYGRSWKDEIYHPKKTIKCGWTANQMYLTSNITDTKVPIDITGCGANCASMFQQSEVHTVAELIVAETNSLSSTFSNATNLANLTISGVIGRNCNMQWCPLTGASIRSVVSALSDTATGQTVTFNKAAKEAAFTDDEWNALIATKPNWTFSLV